MNGSILKKNKTIVFRVDSTIEIGSGHVMRCIAIAQAFEQLGGKAYFAVSCHESAQFLSNQGRQSVILEGDSHKLKYCDARELIKYCDNIAATVLFVDTYAVTDDFFEGLSDFAAPNLAITYLDDLYTFSCGNLNIPKAFPVNTVVNYSFYAEEEIYKKVFRNETKLLLGPSYAPLRREYWNALEDKIISGSVDNILITTGSTNPNHVLERMAQIARDSFKDASITIVVGSDASYEGLHDSNMNILGPQKSLRYLMQECDICVSAAGSTLYELSSLGVPTLALSIADNQLQNLLAFRRLGLGFTCVLEDSDAVCREALLNLGDSSVRQDFSSKMQAVVEGKGSLKIASALFNS